jgi:predicted nucleic acid-binding protein
MPWVVDCSFSMALLLPDEQTGAVRAFFEGLDPDDTVWVPALWCYETANALSVAVRKKRFLQADASNALTLFSALRLRVDHASGTGYAQRLVELALSWNLSAYDAAYLELALRKGATMLSLDRSLLDAAGRCGSGTWKP